MTELKVLKDHWELQYDRVAGSLCEREETDFITHANNMQAKEEKNKQKSHISSRTYGSHLILKKLLKEELPLLPKASSFSRF